MEKVIMGREGPKRVRKCEWCGKNAGSAGHHVQGGRWASQGYVACRRGAVLTDGKGHNTDSRQCWCQPTAVQA